MNNELNATEDNEETLKQWFSEGQDPLGESQLYFMRGLSKLSIAILESGNGRCHLEMG